MRAGRQLSPRTKTMFMRWKMISTTVRCRKIGGCITEAVGDDIAPGSDAKGHAGWAGGSLAWWMWQPTRRSTSRLPTRRGSSSTAARELRSMRWQSRPRYLAATAVARQWLDWMPPMVMTQSWPPALASAMRNSSLRTCQRKSGTCELHAAAHPVVRVLGDAMSLCAALDGNRRCIGYLIPAQLHAGQVVPLR